MYARRRFGVLQTLFHARFHNTIISHASSPPLQHPANAQNYAKWEKYDVVSINLRRGRAEIRTGKVRGQAQLHPLHMEAGDPKPWRPIGPNSVFTLRRVPSSNLKVQNPNLLCPLGHGFLRPTHHQAPYKATGMRFSPFAHNPFDKMLQ